MEKQLFEFRYGRLSYRGEIHKETPETYALRGRNGTFRVHKTRAMTVLATDAPDAVLEAFRSSYASHTDRIATIKESLQTAQNQQLADAFRAAGLINPFAAVAAQ